MCCPTQYDRDRELTVTQTLQRVDWLYAQGFRFISLIGGEPLAPFKTREGITFAEHTLQVVEYAAQKGMATNVITNGDYLKNGTVKDLKQAGLDSLSLSLHTYSQPGLRHLIEGARMAAEAGIIPTITVVFTAERADQFPGVAAEVARNGVLFGFGLVQEKGGGFSALPEGASQIPTVEQQKQVFRALLYLKRFGMVRNNTRYLNEAPNYPKNSWTCNPNTDTFINLGAEGGINVCTDVRTNLTISDVPLLKADQRWRDMKRERVEHCGNCTFSCYYEAQNTNVTGDIPMIGVLALIKTGHSDLAQKWGQFAVGMSRRMAKDIDWDLKI